MYPEDPEDRVRQEMADAAAVVAVAVVVKAERFAPTALVLAVVAAVAAAKVALAEQVVAAADPLTEHSCLLMAQMEASFKEILMQVQLD